MLRNVGWLRRGVSAISYFPVIDTEAWPASLHINSNITSSRSVIYVNESYSLVLFRD